MRSFGYLLSRVCRPALWSIEFHGAGPRAIAGQVPPGLLADCRDIAAQFAIEHGRVDVVRGPHGPTLRFSPAIPAASHQRLRNVFGVHIAGRR